MILLRTLLAFILLATVMSVGAEVTVRDYRKFVGAPELKDEVQTYVQGVGRGLWMANYVCSSCLFCQPTGFVAQGQNFTQWVDEAVSRDGDAKPDDLIEILLLVKMIRVFPCKKP